MMILPLSPISKFNHNNMMSEQNLIGLFFMEVLIINIGQMLMLRRYNLSGQILKLPYISERREKVFALLLHWSTIYKDTGY